LTSRGDRLRRRKEELRTRMREAREAIPPAERSRLSRSVGERLFALPEVRRARTMALFSSFGAELDTTRMIERAHAEERRVVLPYLEGSAMEVAEHGPGDELVRSSYGATEPASRAAVDPTGIEVVVAPGLAFDRAGRRLGYGRGYYDHWLRRVSDSAFLVGVCFAVQIVDRVPATSSDIRMEAVVTDLDVIRVAARRGKGQGPPL
jgi:5-formyltetrahydrofolate cyclo-ligase